MGFRLFLEKKRGEKEFTLQGLKNLPVHPRGRLPTKKRGGGTRFLGLGGPPETKGEKFPEKKTTWSFQSFFSLNFTPKSFFAPKGGSFFPL